MKSLNVFKKSGLAALAIMLIMNVATAQSRYKHVPRTKVDKKHELNIKTNDVKQTNNVTTNEVVTPVTETANVTPVVTESPVEVTAVASNNTSEVVVVNHPVKSVVAKKDEMKENKRANHDSFVNKLNEKSTLLKVKDVKKTLLQKWLLWMIICLAIAVVFTILAAVFPFISWTLSLVFWIIAGLAWIAALIFLILGLAGVM